jgi:hypothetical protein
MIPSFLQPYESIILNPAFSGAIGAIASCALFTLLNNMSLAKKTSKAGGWRVLKYTWVHKIIALSAVIFFGGVLYIMFTVPNYATSPQGMFFAKSIFLAFLILGLILIYESFFRLVRFNSKYIDSIHFYGTRRISIPDIEYIRFSHMMNMVKVKTHQGQCMWLPFVAGIALLIRYLEFVKSRQLSNSQQH